MKKALGVLLGICMLLGVATQSYAQWTLPDGFDSEMFIEDGPFIRMFSMAVDPDGHMFVTDSHTNNNDGKVYKIDMDTRHIDTLLDTFPMPQPNVVLVGDGRALTGNDLIISDHNAHSSGNSLQGTVFRVNKDTGAFTELYMGNPEYPDRGDPSGMALAPGGDWGNGIYVMDFQGASNYPPVLWRLNEDGSAETFVVDPVQWPTTRNPHWIAFDPNGDFGGDLFVSDPNSSEGIPSGPPALFRVNSAGELSMFVEGQTGDMFADFAFGLGGAFGTDIYILGIIQGVPGLNRIAPDGTNTLFGLPTIPANEEILGAGIAFAPDGSSLFVGLGDTIYRIFPSCNMADSDDDGVIDQWDNCPDTPAGALTDKYGCSGPQPNASLDLWHFRLNHFKRFDWTTMSMSGQLDLIDFDPAEGPVQSRTTVELFGVMPDGGDLVISNENTLEVFQRRGLVTIRD